MLLTKLKAAFHRIVPATEEDRVINAAKAGDVQPFIAYFRDNNIPFVPVNAIASNSFKASPTGRVMYENDIYSYVYIDGVWIDRIELQLPYEQRKALFDEMEDAVLENVYGTVAYEKKYLTPKEAA